MRGPYRFRAARTGGIRLRSAFHPGWLHPFVCRIGRDGEKPDQPSLEGVGEVESLVFQPCEMKMSAPQPTLQFGKHFNHGGTLIYTDGAASARAGRGSPSGESKNHMILALYPRPSV